MQCSCPVIVPGFFKEGLFLYCKKTTVDSNERIERRSLDHRSLVENAKTYLDKLAFIRDYYLAWEDVLIEHCKTNPRHYYYVNSIEWPNVFTPIEQLAWDSIRCKPGMVLYPQYPVGKYTIDFAHPLRKIGIELDGKQYHDKNRDTIRDRELLKMGWTIYRIKGSEMYNKEAISALSEPEMSEDDYEAAIRTWLRTSGDGVIHAISVKHFASSCINNDWYQYYEETLKEHKLT